MSQLGQFFTELYQRHNQANQDRATILTMLQQPPDADETQQPTNPFDSSGGSGGTDGTNAPDNLVQRGKQAGALRNALKAYTQNPDAAKALDGMSADQLEGVLHGYTNLKAQEMQGAQVNRFNAEAQRYQIETQEQVAEAGATGTLMKRFGEIRQQNPNIQPGDAMMQAFGDVGQMNPRAGAMLLKTFAPSITGMVANKNNFFKPGDNPQAFGNWSRIPTGPNTSQLIYNDPNQGQMTPQMDASGNLIGYSTADARGHSTFHAAKGSAKLKQATDQNGNPIEGFYMDDSGKLHDTRSAMDKLMGDENAPAQPAGKATPAAPAASAAQYKNKDDVVSDYKAGKITRAAASKILNEQFNVPLK